MGSLYVVNDADGFICAYKTKKEAEDLICEYGKQHRLFIMLFTNTNTNTDTDTIWFLPYRDLHIPIVVSNDAQYVKNIQLQLLKMNLVYTDNIDFYKRKIGEIGSYEHYRLLLPDIDDDADSDESVTNTDEPITNIDEPITNIDEPITAPNVMEQPQLLSEIISDVMKVSCKDCITKEEHNHPTVE